MLTRNPSWGIWYSESDRRDVAKRLDVPDPNDYEAILIAKISFERAIEGRGAYLDELAGKRARLRREREAEEAAVAAARREREARERERQERRTQLQENERTRRALATLRVSAVTCFACKHVNSVVHRGSGLRHFSCDKCHFRFLLDADNRELRSVHGVRLHDKYTSWAKW